MYLFDNGVTKLLPKREERFMIHEKNFIKI